MNYYFFFVRKLGGKACRFHPQPLSWIRFMKWMKSIEKKKKQTHQTHSLQQNSPSLLQASERKRKLVFWRGYPFFFISSFGFLDPSFLSCCLWRVKVMRADRGGKSFTDHENKRRPEHWWRKITLLTDELQPIRLG